jgi:hypothetical protein
LYRFRKAATRDVVLRAEEAVGVAVRDAVRDEPVNLVVEGVVLRHIRECDCPQDQAGAENGGRESSDDGSGRSLDHLFL